MKTHIVLAVVIATVSCGSIPESVAANLNDIVRSAPVALNQIEGRIVGGTPALREQFPYQAGISYYKDRLSYWCGGALISQQWVLTAAHCMYYVSNVVVYLGSNIRSSGEPGTLRMEINNINNSIFFHERYNHQDTSNDIALIRLPYNVTYTNYIKPVELPRRQTVYPLFHDDFVVATGWGKDRDNGQVTEALNFVNVNTMKNTQCVNYYFPGIVKPTNICVNTAGGRGTCSGDSGGPLVSNTYKYLIGITSFGAQTSCQKGYPTVFTRVHYYLDWIEFRTGIRL